MTDIDVALPDVAAWMRVDVDEQLHVPVAAMPPEGRASRSVKGNRPKLIGVRINVVVTNVGRYARLTIVETAEQKSPAFANALAATSQVANDVGP